MVIFILLWISNSVSYLVQAAVNTKKGKAIDPNNTTYVFFSPFTLLFSLHHPATDSFTRSDLVATGLLRKGNFIFRLCFFFNLHEFNSYTEYLAQGLSGYRK